MTEGIKSCESKKKGPTKDGFITAELDMTTPEDSKKGITRTRVLIGPGFGPARRVPLETFQVAKAAALNRASSYDFRCNKGIS